MRVLEWTDLSMGVSCNNNISYVHVDTSMVVWYCSIGCDPFPNCQTSRDFERRSSLICAAF
eukprot:scaffold3079_cov174-Amphora_coffeaeformis.AAC.29